ncbi:MAG: enoyl-CoA hydratase/isomerase family protein [Acidimicrobiales bacterium]|nr:enoyl-CoA hydratase/isomerase family protein [Acidimicrobiales bacterium]
MDGALVRVERRDDGVAVVTLDNPKVNALSQELLNELGEVFAALGDDLPGAVVVTGGERLFAAGADVTQFSADRAADIAATFHRVLDAVAAFPRPTIAAISGYALGGGCELAMACDFRIASEKAVFGQPEILLGIIPGGGGTQRLPRLVGASRAKDLIFTGRQVTSEEALFIGLADEVVAPEDLHDRALAFAAELAAGPVQAIALAKAAIDGTTTEQQAFTDVFQTDDASIGVQSFLEHGPGKATFTGR